jgi:hypothetical protein
MATYNPRHFTDADVLLTIAPERLLRLLEPYAEYFDDQGLPLPSARQAATLDVVRLAGILESPGESAPQDLLNAIGYIDEMSTPSGMDALLPKAIVAGMDFDASEDLSPADIAVQVWLFDPTIVEREHIWHTWKLPRRMDCFQAEFEKQRMLLELTPERIEDAQGNVGDWLGENNRSRFCQISHRIVDTKIEFSIQRGDPFTRKQAIADESIQNIHFRPAGKDKVIFLMEEKMLQINSPIKRAIPIYQRVFGKLLFDDAEYFSDTNIISLRPLEELGANALLFGDMTQIEEVLFVEYCVDLGGDQGATITYKARNIIVDMQQRGRELEFEGRLISATFRIRYRGSRELRTLKLYDGNATCYTRDRNAHIAEQWMRLRKFIVETQAKPESEATVESDSVLEEVNSEVNVNDSALVDA